MENMQKSHAIQPIDGNDPPDVGLIETAGEERHGVAISGIYLNTSKDFTRPPLPGLSRALKAEKHDAGVIIQRGRGRNKGGIHKETAPTLTANCWQENNLLYTGLAIRKLTPRECFRLQGWTDEYFERAALVNCDNQLYRQAGNGVTVNVVHEIGLRLGD